MSAGTRQRARRVPTTASARRAMREAVTVLLDQLLSVSPRSLSVESKVNPRRVDRDPRDARLRSTFVTALPPPVLQIRPKLLWRGRTYVGRSPRRPPSRTETRMPARASAERPANRGNVPAHPTVLFCTVILARRRDRIRSRNGRIANGPAFRSRGERGESDVTDR